MRMHGGRHWGGVGPRKPQDAKRAFKRSIEWAKPLVPVLVFGLFATLSGVFLAQQPPRLIQHTIDNIIAKDAYEKLTGLILLYLGVVIGSQLITSISGYYMNLAGQRLLHTLRVTVYDHFQLLSLSYYDDKRTGDLVARVTGDVNQLEGLIINTSNSLVRQVFGVGFAFYYMCLFNWRLAMLVLIPIPLLAVSLYFFTRKIRVVYRSIRENFGEFSAKLMENISGMRVIKAFNREIEEHVAIESTSSNLRNQNIKATKMTSVFYPAIQTLSTIGTVLVLGVGAYMISKGAFTIGKLTAFLIYVGNFYQPVGEFIRTFDSIQRALASGERIFEVLDTVPAVQDPAESVEMDKIDGAVEFENVNFKYATGEEVLNNVSVKAKPGQRIAIVGQSGAGKSSFINLIPRFYDVTSGSVLIDGVDVRNFRQSDIRKHISMVLQETFLFNGTVKENLKFGKPDATDDEITEAANAANAHEFISKLEQGYDTQIGERGIKLSGGQKQRLAIARAVLANPAILILDEATSSVDSESEFLIHEAVDNLMMGRTTFIIAHRLSTIRSADVILVLSGGSIVERGNHDELLEANGRYAEMYHQQFWLEEDSDEDIGSIEQGI